MSFQPTKDEGAERSKSKINKLYWISVALVLVGGVSVCIYIGLQPKTVPKIKWSAVDQPEEFGSAIYQRLRQEITSAPIVLVGIDPSRIEQKKLSKGIVDSLRRENPNFVIVSDFRFELKEMLQAEEILNPEVSGQDVLNSVEYVLKQDRRVLLVIPAGNTTHLIHRNLVNLMRDFKKYEPIIAITVTHFPRSRSEESQSDLKCRNESGDPTGYGNFSCMVLGKARSTYLKKPPGKNFIGLMDQTGLNDYLVLFREQEDVVEL